MKTILLLLAGVLVASLPLRAEESAGTVSIGGKKVELVHQKKKRITIDRRCAEMRPPTACQALEASDRATLDGLKDELLGGANPGAVVCGHLNGAVVVGYDEQGNENSFCQFPDGTLIDNGSLHYQAYKATPRSALTK